MGVRRIFSRGGRAWQKFQNFQGSPLGCVFRFPVSKITKGPPLVKIFDQSFWPKNGIFLQRAHLTRKLYYFVMLFYHRKHLISPKFCMALDRRWCPRARPAGRPCKISTKICYFSIKYCSGRIFIRFHEFPACLHFGFASPDRPRTGNAAIFRSLRRRRERKIGVFMHFSRTNAHVCFKIVNI